MSLFAVTLSSGFQTKSETGLSQPELNIIPVIKFRIGVNINENKKKPAPFITAHDT
jgi:hypothetical protein